MNKKLVKILTTVLLIVMMVSVAANCFAIDHSQITGSTDGTGSTEIANVGKSIVGILQTVGIILSVIVLIILGIKYMMGSAEEKADYKKSMIPYLVGAILIFAASALAQVVYQFVTGISAA